MNTTIPQQIQAGDTLEWTESYSDYPASSWTLRYKLNGANNITLTATADGDDHDFAVTAAVSTLWKPGFYEYIKYVSDGTESYTLETGKLEILRDLRTAAAGFDARSHVLIVKEALEAVIEGRATKAQESIQIAGRAVSYLKPEELRKEWLHYKRLYENELAADKLARGEGSGRKIVARFTTPL